MMMIMMASFKRDNNKGRLSERAKNSHLCEKTSEKSKDGLSIVKNTPDHQRDQLDT